MIKKLFIFVFIFTLSACSTKEIKNINYKNFNYNQEQLNNSVKFSNKKQDFCLLVLCSDYRAISVDDFIFNTIKKANKKGIKGNTIANIKLDKKEFMFLIFTYRYIKIQGNIIDNKAN